AGPRPVISRTVRCIITASEKPRPSPDLRRDPRGQGEVLFRVDLGHVGPLVPEYNLGGLQPEPPADLGPVGVAELVRVPGDARGRPGPPRLRPGACWRGRPPAHPPGRRRSRCTSTRAWGCWRSPGCGRPAARGWGRAGCPGFRTAGRGAGRPPAGG